MKVVYLDTETTGLHVHLGHEVWEVGMLISDTENLDKYGEVLIRIAPDLSCADPGAIRVNKFYETTADMQKGHFYNFDNGVDLSGETWSIRRSAAYYIAKTLADALIIGNNPAFDEVMLADLCRRNGYVLANFHRKINVVDMALGRLHHIIEEVGVGTAGYEDINAAVQLPHSSQKVLDAAGCPPNTAAHTALGDARHVRDAYLHLIGHTQS